MKYMFHRDFVKFYKENGGPEVLLMNTYGYSNFLESEEGQKIYKKWLDIYFK